MLGLYFSGTGSAKHCVEYFVRQFDVEATCISIEDKEAKEAIVKDDFIVIGYPIYYSNLPKIMRDFLVENRTLFYGKKVFIIVTMGLFCGDGAGCCSRLLKKEQAKIVGGLHLKMPDCICDEKLLKRSLEQNRALVVTAQTQIDNAVNRLKSGNPTKQGLGIFYHIAGLFGQRLWFYNMTKEYSNMLKIDKEKCVGCGKCVELCPMENLQISNNIAQQKGQCTMCYRCINNCPKKAMTLLGKRIYEQSLVEKYL